MSSATHVSVRWSVLIAMAFTLLAVGAGAAWVGLRATRAAPPSPGAAGPVVQEAPASATSGSTPDLSVRLGEEAVARAGITLAEVQPGSSIAELRAPAIVEPDAYKLVAVTSLVGGRITDVKVELGQHVQRGQILARMFSPDRAELQTRYVSTKAQLEAHERELARTERLATIGAASRQELERLHAEHTSRRADLQSVASRLQLLGLSPEAIDGLGPATVDSAVDVRAPIAGVITGRAANVGVNVDPSTMLFTLVDLSHVWVVADLYERDVARISVGARATVTSAAPGLVLQGRVSYIDPQIAAATRTARVRIAAPNAGEQLRLGAYAEVRFHAEGEAAGLTIPRGAVQHVADRTVVYVSDPRAPGTFVEREVRVGSSVGDRVSVLAGVEPGDRVVATGSFFVRAERERLGPPSASTLAPAPATTRAAATVQTARIVVGDSFEPATVSLRTGTPARLTFVRTSDRSCATEVVFPSLSIKRGLPLARAVVIELTPRTGEIAFTCGMNMLKGRVVAR
jgi:membrane fusion protein, heavy metal efflux system